MPEGESPRDDDHVDSCEDREAALGDRQFEEVASSSPAIMWVTAADGMCIFLNPQWYRMTGQEDGAGLGLGWTDAIHPDDRSNARRAFLEANASHQKFEVDYRLRQADGSYRWSFDAGQPRFRADGTYLGMIGVLIDIEDRKKAEHRLSYAAQAAGVGFWYCDLPFADLVWDDRVKEHFHLPPGAHVTIDTFYDRIHPDDREPTRETIDRSIRNRITYATDFRTVDPISGDIKWIRALGGAAFAEDNTPLTFDGLTLDITERIAGEELLKQSESRFRHLADAMPQIVFAAEPDGTVDYFNRQWYEYTGFAKNDSPGRESWEKVHEPGNLERIKTVWAEAVRTGQPYEIEYRLRRSDGMFRWHLGRALPIRDSDGQIVRWYGTNTDIHDQKMAEAAAATARDQAQAANRMKDEFLATLSHELRTPLNAILGWAKLLRSGNMDDQDFEEGLAAIERNSVAQAQIIEDLLDVSRIISGNFKMEVQNVNLREIIESALDSVMPAATAKNIRIHRLLDTLAGPVSGDPARLQQVVWNLISNAVKFTPKGGQVQVLLERVNSHIEISVIDTGLGIKPEFLPFVFDRFRQADSTTTRRHGGLGLGLAITKQLVEMHGGSVRVKSPGEAQGSTFTVMLPLTVVHPDPSPHEKPRSSSSPPANNVIGPGVLAGVKVLVVDDEPDARLLIRKVLSGCDAEVEIAASASEGMALVEIFQPDVIVSDIGMPDEDGYDFIRKVRAKRSSRDLPAAALTAFARAEDRRQALLAGFQTHVAKPVDPSELVAVVASLAGKTGVA